jgi:hypothetical protein
MRYFLIFFLIIFGTACQAQFEDARCACFCLDSDSNGQQKKKEWIGTVQAVECVCENILKENSALCSACKCQYQVRNTNIMKVVICMVVAVITGLTLYMIILQLLEKRLGSSSSRRDRHDSDERPPAAPGTYQRFSDTLEMQGSTSDLTNNRPMLTPDVPKTVSDDGRGYSRMTDDVSLVVDRPYRQQIDSQATDDTSISGLESGGGRGRLEFQQPTGFQIQDEHSSDIGGRRTRTRSDAVSDAFERAKDQQKRWQGCVQVQRARVFDDHSMLN